MFRAVAAYFQGSYNELRQVVWPTRREVIQYTAIIIVSVAVTTLIIAILDYGLTLLVNHYLIKA